MGRTSVVLGLALALSSLADVAPLQAQSIREVFDQVSHAVVTVYTSQSQYTLRASGITAVDVGGIGSGVLISPTRILTAAHVVQAANEVVVQFPDGEVMRASVLASRQTHDVALLELEGAATVAPVEIGDSDAVTVGDQIFVVGAPLGQAFTLTVGYVSARRTSPGMLGSSSTLELIQTDAAINPGNSGGPMFSLDGEVVGIVSHILSQSGGSQGLGFAVSAGAAQEVLQEGRSFWSGLEGREVTGALAALLNWARHSKDLVVGNGLVIPQSFQVIGGLSKYGQIASGERLKYESTEDPVVCASIKVTEWYQRLRRPHLEGLRNLLSVTNQGDGDLISNLCAMLDNRRAESNAALQLYRVVLEERDAVDG